MQQQRGAHGCPDLEELQDKRGCIRWHRGGVLGCALDLLSLYKFVGLKCKGRQGHCRRLRSQSSHQNAELLPALP